MILWPPYGPIIKSFLLDPAWELKYRSKITSFLLLMVLKTWFNVLLWIFFTATALSFDGAYTGINTMSKTFNLRSTLNIYSFISNQSFIYFLSLLLIHIITPFCSTGFVKVTVQINIIFYLLIAGAIFFFVSISTTMSILYVFILARIYFCLLFISFTYIPFGFQYSMFFIVYDFVVNYIPPAECLI